MLRQQQSLLEQVNALAGRNEELLAQLEAWRDGRHDREEAARSGLIAPGEKFVVFRNSKSTSARSMSIIPPAYKGMNVEHLRLLWLVISGLVLLTWFILKRRGNAPALPDDEAGDFDEN